MTPRGFALDLAQVGQAALGGALAAVALVAAHDRLLYLDVSHLSLDAVTLVTVPR